MVLNGRPLKRLNRRVTDNNKISNFCEPLDAIETRSGAFRCKIKEFLSKNGSLPSPSSLLQNLVTWQIVFKDVLVLDVVEEDVFHSTQIYCDHCRVVGWSGNPVCAKRYHFIIKADGHSIGGYHKSCAVCGEDLHLSESRCKSCNHVMTAEDVEDWIYNQLENTTHLLHGVVHSNGFGHLLRVNGREGGSRVLSGCHIMNFWDRLCILLGVRKVSVMDVSKKYGLEYRLLHSIIKGRPWYGDWGYKFGAGSFALTLDAYEAAIDTLSKQPLPNFVSQGRKPRTRLQDAISFYKSLSEIELSYTKDLFCFLLSLIHDARKDESSSIDASCKKRRISTSSALCAWTQRDVERVENAMLRVLRAVSRTTWVSWQTLRGAVCKVAASRELLDYCLKGIEGKQTVDGMVVHAQCNPNSGVIEYRLKQGDGPGNNGMGCISGVMNCAKARRYPSEEQLIRDLRYLYESLLHPETMVKCTNRNEVMRSAARKVLDCKQFVKDYTLTSSRKSSARGLEISTTLSAKIHISCQVELMYVDKDEGAATNLPPPELLVLSPNATVGDLKREASKAFEDVYLMFRRFVAEELVDFCGVDDSTQVKLLLGNCSPSSIVRVRGRCFAKNCGFMYKRFRMERGLERWTVDCRCGAKDDDGERMLACDVCGVWNHTRCAGISDCDNVPARFVCRKCFRAPLVVSSPHPAITAASSKPSKKCFSCN